MLASTRPKRKATSTAPQKVTPSGTAGVFGNKRLHDHELGIAEASQAPLK